MISSKTPFDRTNDFVKAVAAAKADAERQGKSNRLKPMTKAELSEFAEEAASIGRAIHCTTQKLKLFAEEIAKTKSLFQETTMGAEVSKTTAEINKEVHNIQKSIEDLSQKQLKGNSDSNNHNKKVVEHLNVLLSKTSEEFRTLLRKRAGNLEEQQEQKRRLLHIDAIPQIAMKPTKSPAAFSVESDDNSNNGLSDSGASSLLRQRNGVSQTQSQALLQHDDYLSQRADAMQQVETTLTQLQTMFRQVTDMVQLQGEYVERIDIATTESEQNVQGALNIFQKELARISSNRGLVFKSIGIVFLMILVWIIFFL